MPMRKLELFTLLYLDDSTEHENLGANRGSPIDIYLNCAAGAVRSAREIGINLGIITNEASFVRQRLARHAISHLNIIQHSFSLDVPPGIRFRQAHFKLEAMEILGQGQLGEFVGLVDGDVVIRSADDLVCAAEPTLLVYDITKSRSEREIRADFFETCGIDTGNWYGGEFIAGHASAFRALSSKISQLWPHYLNAVIAKRVVHVGDELIVSVAINSLRDQRGIRVDSTDAVARWWTARTGFRQAPFSEIQRKSVLHLPSDKEFLARFALSRRSYDDFLVLYRRHAVPKLFARKIYTFATSPFTSGRHFVASMGMTNEH